jgi:predicted chitinase
MATRTAYGNSFSENGWPMVDEGSCSWTTVPGADVTLEIQNGQPLQILRAWAADINAYVQPLRDADSACWTATNSVGTSNHLSGTAEDLDWDDHPMGNEYAGWSSDQIATIRDMLSFYEDTIFWGNDWDEPKDSMHFQMGYNSYNSPATQDFINRKITADGFSTYRRDGSVPIPPAAPAAPAATSAAATLAAAIGSTDDFAASILSAVSAGLVASQCTNVNRIAMWLAQIGEESAGFTATVEIGDIDGTTYQGRTWIQITGEGNYAAFSAWAFQANIPGVTSADYFVNNPAALGDEQYAGIGPAWYWTVARPTINSLCDAGNVTAVTELINGGDNGLDVRIANYNLAISQGDALLTLLTGDDDMFTDDDRNLLNQISGIFRPSLSPLRWPGEGNVNTDTGFSQTADANIHVILVEKLAVTYGDANSIAMLYAVANCMDPARSQDSLLAAKILSKVNPGDLALANDKIQQWLNAEAAAKAAA